MSGDESPMDTETRKVDTNGHREWELNCRENQSVQRRKKMDRDICSRSGKVRTLWSRSLLSLTRMLESRHEG
jgi:hypothetical protein